MVDPEDREELFGRLYRWLAAHIRSRGIPVSSEWDAEDIASIAILRFLQSEGRHRSRTSRSSDVRDLRSCMAAIAREVSSDLVRRGRLVGPTAQQVDWEGIVHPGSEQLKREALPGLEECNLGADLEAIVRMRTIQEMSLREIAKELGITRRQVKRRWERASGTLLRKLPIPKALEQRLLAEAAAWGDPPVR